MTGKEIYKKIISLHKNYITSEEELEQPELILSKQDVFKLLDCVGLISAYATRLMAMSEGDICVFNMFSVRIVKKEEERDEGID